MFDYSKVVQLRVHNYNVYVSLAATPFIQSLPDDFHISLPTTVVSPDDATPEQKAENDKVKLRDVDTTLLKSVLLLRTIDEITDTHQIIVDDIEYGGTLKITDTVLRNSE